MAMTITHPTPEGDDRTERGDLWRAIAAGFLVFLGVFLAITGVITLIQGNQELGQGTRTLTAVHQNTAQTAHAVQGLSQLNINAAAFFKGIGPVVVALEENSYLTCLAVHPAGYVGCVPPPSSAGR
jgi:hypothetical protein